MAAHVGNQPTAVTAVANRAFVAGLSIIDRSFTQQLIEKYGAEMYTFCLALLGRSQKVENREFYHYEKRRSTKALKVASISPVSPTAGVDVTVTIHADSHYDSGTKTAAREGEVVMVSASGVQGQIQSINTAVAGAHTILVKPLKSTAIFAPAANDWLLCQGRQHLGEATTKGKAQQPIQDKITNYVTEIREDYEITDMAMMEKIEFADPKTGRTNFRYVGTSEAEKNFNNTREFLTVFANLVTNAGITANGTTGTRGMIEQILAGGSDLAYTAGSMTIDNWQAMTRELTWNGASPEIHMLQDIYQHQEVTDTLFALFGQSILWGSVGGSKEVAAAYGFSSLSLDGFTFHRKKYAPFSPEWVWGVTPASTPAYRHFGIAIPQGFSNQPNGSKLPTIGLVYQEIPGKGEIYSWESGGLAEVPTSDELKLYNHIFAKQGVRAAAANQCVIFQG